MDFPIDAGRMGFVVVTPARQATDWNTREPKTDREGRPVWEVWLTAMDGTDAVQVKVKIPGDPQVQPGQMVRPAGLRLSEIARGGETVRWWSADGLEASGAAGSGSGGGKAAAGSSAAGRES